MLRTAVLFSSLVCLPALAQENNQFFAQINNEPKRRLTLRADNAFSFKCTENYYKLSKESDEVMLTPVSLYRGEGEPLRKML